MQISSASLGSETKLETPGKQIVDVMPTYHAVKTVAMNLGGNPTTKTFLKN
jgi:hypothetical protein